MTTAAHHSLDEEGIGEVPPHWKAGPFQIRLPFVHYRFEWPDYVQGLLMCAVDLAAIPLMVELLGMPFEVALAVVVFNGLLYLTHHLLGDPVVPGWITPAIPLVMAYCSAFPEGEERVHALIAFQFMLGVFSITLGATGLASKVVSLIPSAIKAGVLVGAGIAAVQSLFVEGGRFETFPVTITTRWGSPSSCSSPAGSPRCGARTRCGARSATWASSR